MPLSPDVQEFLSKLDEMGAPRYGEQPTDVARQVMRNLTPEDLEAQDAEFIVLFSGFDETFSQIVHVRGSYKYYELVSGARFVDMFGGGKDGVLSVDLGRIHDIQKAGVETH